MQNTEQVYMNNDIWVFPLEPLDNRYTKQWYTEIPRLLEESLVGTNNKVYSVDGDQTSSNTTKGAFLDFSDTNLWKSTQLASFIRCLQEGLVSDSAILLITDFWNPVITQIAYMRDLLEKDWKIHSIAHAGAYDPSDILGLKMQKPWPWELERSMFYACDVTYFATEFHRNMFLKNLDIPVDYHDKAVLSGQPHGAIIESMAQIEQPVFKSPSVIWPHRYNEDKQPEIAEDLARDFDVTITQKLDLDKASFYETLADSQVLFSCALHENLGISVMEGVLLNVIPLLPDRCSYAEMYYDEFKYPSEWTENWENYTVYRPKLVERLNNILDNPNAYTDVMQAQREVLVNNYLSADAMVQRLTGSSD